MKINLKRAFIALPVVAALVWWMHVVAVTPIDCNNGFQLGQKIFLGQGNAVACKGAPEPQHYVVRLEC